MMPRRSIAFIALGLAAAILVAGCGPAISSGGASAVREVPPAESAVHEVPPAEAALMIDDRTVIDVRTAAEYAAGHVEGAINIDVEAGDFEQRIASLDRAAPYLVYCRSGRRSALAADSMAKAGFTDIVDAGGLEPLAAAGAPVE